MKVIQEDLESALSYARRSVLEEDLYRFDHFNRIVKQVIVIIAFSFEISIPLNTHSNIIFADVGEESK